MSPGLQEHAPGPPACRVCGREAAGQCALCHAYLCGECATLVEGLSRPLAVCPSCAHKKPRAGRALVAWIFLPLLFLVLVALLIWWLR